MPSVAVLIGAVIGLAGLAGCARDAASPPAAPRLVVAEPRFDAGTVDQGDAVRHRFVVRNEGGSPLQIGSVRAACDCSATVAGEAAIPPGGDGTIDVEVRTSDWIGAETAVRSLAVSIAADAPTGPFSETVAVRTTHPRRPVVEIVVAGVVLEPGEER